jgi:MOSC domain-containing protein YiiM
MAGAVSLFESVVRQTRPLSVCQLFTSPGHNFFGHHEQPAGEHRLMERVEICCVAGRGVVGDRFFDYKRDYKGQITFFSIEVFEKLCVELGVRGKSAGVARRNVITVGADLNAFIGEEFEIQGVRFAGIAECSPCHWMEQAIAPGAEQFLKGRGGLRAQILTDGILRTRQREPALRWETQGRRN